MRIISKFHDYYDGVMGLGQDQTTIYSRQTRILEGPIVKVLRNHAEKAPGRSEGWFDRPAQSVTFDKGPYSSLHVRFNILVFCGKVYKYCEVHGWPRDSLKTEIFEDHFYTLADLSQFLESHGKLVKDIYRTKFSDGLKGLRKIEAFLDPEKQGSNELEDELVKARIVVAASERVPETVDDYAWQADVQLKPFRFYKVKDSYTAFQELDMYISGVLGQQAKEMVNISDKDRIYQHGFDGYSFKKPPEEKGQRKKQNG